MGHPSVLWLNRSVPWTKRLPLALLRIRTAPRKDTGLSPCKMLFGLPYLGRKKEVLQFETKDMFLKNHILRLSSSLSSLRILEERENEESEEEVFGIVP